MTINQQKNSARIICFCLIIAVLVSLSPGQPAGNQANPPIYIAFLWHMHQPIYYPGESVIQTEQNSYYPYSLLDIFNQRVGPYTHYPADAVYKGINAGLDHFGVQISFSGSLIANLNQLAGYGNTNFQNWTLPWNTVLTELTSLGNPRLDMVSLGYFHPLLGLIWSDDVQSQIQRHKAVLAENFNLVTGSKGIFPPENAFAPQMIPQLTAAGFDWVLIDNIHFERAANGYPFTTAGNLYEPNKSDIRNQNPNDWVQLNGLWAPTQISAQWAHQPHYIAYIDPETGAQSKVIAVPADRYMGIEDGRGGFGALNYEAVMSQLESYNTDPEHPILIVLAHDGDNHGGGSSAYYTHNFQSFVDWLQNKPSRFVCTTIQDYLEMYPPDSDDVIHVEPGSWSGADNGDPEFKKWLADENAAGYSADRNSWAIMTAAKNYVATAKAMAPLSENASAAQDIFLTGESSDYWYWDYSLAGLWDSHPARAANQAIQLATSVISGDVDSTAPTIFIPRREPYNPGGREWNQTQPNDFTVWTYVYDLSGLHTVELIYRLDDDEIIDRPNKLYSGGEGVSAWNRIVMPSSYTESQTDPLPLQKAKKYQAQITDHTVIWQTSHTTTPSSSSMLGAPSMERWTFQGLNAGKTTISLEFGRSWTAPGPDDWSLKVNVTVVEEQKEETEDKSTKEIGEGLVRDLFKDMKNLNLRALENNTSKEFQAIHTFGASSREEEMETIKDLDLGKYHLSDFNVTREGDVLVVTYKVSADETLKGEKVSSKPTPRLSVFVKTDSGWKWLAHANPS